MTSNNPLWLIVGSFLAGGCVGLLVFFNISNEVEAPVSKVVNRVELLIVVLCLLVGLMIAGVWLNASMGR